MAEMENATVDSSFAEYQAPFEEPVFSVWDRPHTVLDPVARTLKHSGLVIDNVSRTTDQSDLRQAGIEFSLLGSRLVLRIRPSGLYVWVNNPSWSEENQIGLVIKAAIDAAVLAVKAKLQLQIVTLAMHVRPSRRTLAEITSNFMRFDGAASRFGQLQSYGFSVYGAQGFWVVDRSWVYPGSLFIRLQRVIPSLSDYWSRAQDLLSLNLLFLPLEESLIRRAHGERVSAEILTNDSMIVACMRVYGISSLASNDGDFEGVSGIMLFSPKDLSP